MGCIEKYRTPDGTLAERDCYSGKKPPPQPEGGPGTELKKLLATIGITAAPTCSCNARAKRMDANGIEWCEEHLDEIVGWLREEHAKRRDAGETRLPWTDFGATQLVKLACRRARAKAAS